jgi:hypothetical protein
MRAGQILCLLLFLLLCYSFYFHLWVTGGEGDIGPVPSFDKRARAPSLSLTAPAKLTLEHLTFV